MQKECVKCGKKFSTENAHIGFCRKCRNKELKKLARPLFSKATDFYNPLVDIKGISAEDTHVLHLDFIARRRFATDYWMYA